MLHAPLQVLCWGKAGKAAQVLQPPGHPAEDDYDSILRVRYLLLQGIMITKPT